MSTTEVHGLDRFLELLDERDNVEGRERGLITGKIVTAVGCDCLTKKYSLESRICVRITARVEI